MYFLCFCVRPSTNVVPHDSFGPWKHLLARSGFVELVPVVFPVVVAALVLPGIPNLSEGVLSTRQTGQGLETSLWPNNLSRTDQGFNLSRTGQKG